MTTIGTIIVCCIQCIFIFCVYKKITRFHLYLRAVLPGVFLLPHRQLFGYRGKRWPALIITVYRNFSLFPLWQRSLLCSLLAIPPPTVEGPLRVLSCYFSALRQGSSCRCFLFLLFSLPSSCSTSQLLCVMLGPTTMAGHFQGFHCQFLPALGLPG